MEASHGRCLCEQRSIHYEAYDEETERNQAASMAAALQKLLNLGVSRAPQFINALLDSGALRLDGLDLCSRRE
jgi:hypothetical protein